MDLQLKKISVSIKKISTKNFDKIDDSFDLIALVNIDGKEENISKRYRYGIKINECVNILNDIGSDKFVKDDHVLTLLRFHELDTELTKAIKK